MRCCGGMNIKSIINKKLIVRAVSFVLILLWCALIFFMSSEIADDSAKRSGGIINKMASIAASLFGTNEPDPSLIDVYEFYLRKLAHMFLYFVLALLSVCFLSTYPTERVKILLYSLAFCLFYAITDEIHQLFVEGRSGSFKDVMIDMCGTLTARLLVWAFFHIRGRIRK